MSLKITQSSLLEKKSLEVHSSGVTLFETAGFGRGKIHPFSEIDCVLISPDHKLSVQVGQKVFSIQTNPSKDRHKEVIDALLREVRRTTGRA